ncbi:YitT family protein [Sinanaerobacter sp. ZZT-01]|uniref:YitT family protein n=1 Tax=Sinanaerobacter sp. ZZT-01 TaxID=3111540 RepID=UPI002D76ABAB|nr:YitT family protein [Sinanaerobacter sp. ZZT-01]WRR92218.1 YitT family protein [Sinanaerobacter sp. ZZT-01]
MRVNLFQIKKIIMVLLGNAVYAFGVAAFIIPNGLITGGSTGLALFFHYQFSIPVSVFVGIFNIIMFLLGAWILGKSFALTTLVSTFFYPVILSLFQHLPFSKGLTENPILAIVYAGGMIGLGIGFVLREGASTGGMDIPPLLLNKKFGLSISIMLYVFDSGILLLQMFQASVEQVLSGILVVLIYTVVLDKVLLAGKAQTQVKIISDKYEEINEMILKTMDRGSTLLKAQTGCLRKDQYMVLTVISNRELPKLNAFIKEIDSDAFMMIDQINEVRGRGFTIEKYHKKEGFSE